MAMDAFDLAERLQTLVFVLSDLDLGMNNWMSHPFTYPDKPLDRGKVLTRREGQGIWGPRGAATRTSTATAIPWRTLPGTGRSGVLHARVGPQRDGALQREARTTTSRTSTGSRASSTRPSTLVPAPVVQMVRRREGRHHRLRVEPLRRRGVARPAARGKRHRDVVSAAAGVSVHAGGGRVHSHARSRLRRRAESRRARC